MKKTMVWLCVIALFVSFSLYAAGTGQGDVEKKVMKLVEKGQGSLADNKLDKAEESFQKALQLKADCAAAFAGLATINLRQKKTDAALQNYEKALQIKPDLSPAVSEYGKLLFGLSNQGQKSEFLEKIVALPALEKAEKKMFTTSLYLLGVAKITSKQFDAASGYFGRAAKLTENDPALTEIGLNSGYMLGVSLGQQKKYAESNAVLQPFIEKAQGNTQLTPFVANASYMVAVNLYEEVNGRAEKIKAEDLSAESKAKLAKIEQDRDKIIRSRSANRGPKLVQIDNEVTLVKNQDVQKKKEQIAALAREVPVADWLNKAISYNLPQVTEDAYVRLGNYQYLCQNLEEAKTTYKTLIEKFPASPDLPGWKKFLESLEKETAPKTEKK